VVPPRTGRSVTVAARIGTPLRPQGRIGKRNAPVLKDGEVSPLAFAIVATGDRQLAADTGECPAPSARRPEPEPQRASPHPSRDRQGAVPPAQWPLRNRRGSDRKRARHHIRAGDAVWQRTHLTFRTSEFYAGRACTPARGTPMATRIPRASCATAGKCHGWLAQPWPRLGEPTVALFRQVCTPYEPWALAGAGVAGHRKGM
jgi:hypothetical protein